MSTPKYSEGVEIMSIISFNIINIIVTFGMSGYLYFGECATLHGCNSIILFVFLWIPLAIFMVLYKIIFWLLFYIFARKKIKEDKVLVSILANCSSLVIAIIASYKVVPYIM